MVITLDGPAGSGKSTIAKLLAERFHFYQIDSGAFYRFFTYLFLKYSENKNQTTAEIIGSKDYLNYLSSQTFEVNFEGRHQNIIWNNQNIEQFIRTSEIARNIKIVADNVFIRNEVNKRIQSIAEKYSVVADGRDMGTVVFPDAHFKFFLIASLEVRAKRRFAEFQTSNPGITLEEVISEIDKRDKEDEKREFGKLTPAKDAIFIDTTNLEINGVVNVIVNVIQTKNTNN